MHWLPLLPLLFLSACLGRPMSDAHVPPFAKVPYEPFSRQAVVAIAMREWRLFGQNVADPEADATRVVKPEREDGLWQRVGEYWWLGLERRIGGERLDRQARRKWHGFFSRS